MSKKYYQFKMKAGVVGLHMISLMLAVGILCFSVSQCLLIIRDVEQHRSYDETMSYYVGSGEQIRFINPFESDVKYEETDVFADSFQSDAASLITYLAICWQFETDGVFDPDKEVDVLSFYCRKDPSLNVDSDGAFVYKVHDLITWMESYGFTTYDDNELGEIFFPSDGVPVVEKEEQLYELMTLINSNLQATQTQSDESDSYVEEDAYYEEDEYYEAEENVEEELNITFDEEGYDENTGEEAIGDEAEEVATEESDDVATDDVATDITVTATQGNGEEQIKVTSLKEKPAENEVTLSMEEAKGLYNDILMSVASDLSYNYGLYQQQKDYFINYGNNFKYLYIPDGNENYYTNLSVDGLGDAQSKIQYFNAELAAYAIIDVKNGNIEAKTANVLTSNVLSYLNSYKYAFADGGKLYIGVLDDAVEGFSDYVQGDNYAQLKDLTTNNRMNMEMRVGWILFLLLLSIILLVINTILCGRSTEDEEIHLMAFDYWYTEIAVAIACGVAVLLVSVFFMGSLVIDETSDNFIYHFFHDNYFMMIMVVYVAIVDACFLFFYNSLIRRIKAGCLWKGSMVRAVMKTVVKGGKWCGRGVATVFHNATVLGKTILTFIPVFALLMLHLVAGTYQSGPLLFFGLLLDGVYFILLLYINLSRNKIIEGIERISGGELEYQVDTTHMYGDSLKMAEAVNNIGDGIREAVNQSMKDERMKADLITNVSHDIKTPLTSIINYVDLLKRENVQDETIQSYIEVLDNKSQRLKQLTEDLVEASKISSGNIVLNIEELNVVDLMKQALGEFDDKFESKELKVVESYSENACIINADSRRMWRVIDNLLGNIYKYALEKTRVYVEVRDLKDENKKVSISIKNISKQPLNIAADELTERFIRGDISRSTEGSGLGLSIAKNLVEAQGGTFQLYLDGDLFKVTITF